MSRQFQILNSREPIILDCNRAQCFIIDLSSDVTTARARNISPGGSYTVILHQDAIGHRFTWPPECLNATDVDPAAGATTVQNFIGMPGGVMQANIPGAWTGGT